MSKLSVILLALLLTSTIAAEAEIINTEATMDLESKVDSLILKVSDLSIGIDKYIVNSEAYFNQSSKNQWFSMLITAVLCLMTLAVIMIMQHRHISILNEMHIQALGLKDFKKTPSHAGLDTPDTNIPLVNPVSLDTPSKEDIDKLVGKQVVDNLDKSEPKVILEKEPAQKPKRGRKPKIKGTVENIQEVKGDLPEELKL
jgi:hypothetical protein